MAPISFRKFLIISNSVPPAISGNSSMMHSLLSFFPKDSFSILTSCSVFDDSTDEKRKLKVKYFFFDRPLLVSSFNKEKTFLQKIKAIIKNFWLTKLLAQLFLVFYLIFNILTKGLRIIKDEDIEILLAYSSTDITLLASYFLHKITKKPIYLFFYDLYKGNKKSFFYKYLSDFLEPLLFKDAERVFVMNEPLKRYYQKKYNRKVFVIHNSVLINDREKIKNKSNFSKIFTIVYTGTIYWAQISAIKNLIKAIEEIKNLDIVLYLYTPHDKNYLTRKRIFQTKKVILKKGLPSEMEKVQVGADALFVPLSFNTRFPFLINSSSPGKTYEYMASGRPILIHAPKDSYISKYAKRNKFALVVDENNTAKLKLAIRELVVNKKLVEEITNNARKTLRLNHDAAKNSKFFQTFFIKK